MNGATAAHPKTSNGTSKADQSQVKLVKANEFLICSEVNARAALSLLHPGDPVYRSIVKNLDGLDVTRKLLAKRFL